MPLGAIRFLTVLPLGPHPEPEEVGRRAWLGLPTVGLISGLIAGVVAWLLRSSPAVGPAVVGALVLLEGAQHLDGLVDLGDAILAWMAGGDPERAMKDARVGVGGLAAGALALITLSTCLSSIPFYALVPLEVWSRYAALPLAAVGEPPEYSVSGRVFTEHVDADQVLLGGVVSVLLSLPYSPEATLVCALCALASSWLSLLLAERVVGGVNGDVLGAAVWLARTLSGIPLSCLPW